MDLYIIFWFMYLTFFGDVCVCWMTPIVRSTRKMCQQRSVLKQLPYFGNERETENLVFVQNQYIVFVWNWLNVPLVMMLNFESVMLVQVHIQQTNVQVQSIELKWRVSHVNNASFPMIWIFHMKTTSFRWCKKRMPKVLHIFHL